MTKLTAPRRPAEGLGSDGGGSLLVLQAVGGGGDGDVGGTGGVLCGHHMERSPVSCHSRV